MTCENSYELFVIFRTPSSQVNCKLGRQCTMNCDTVLVLDNIKRASKKRGNFRYWLPSTDVGVLKSDVNFTFHLQTYLWTLQHNFCGRLLVFQQFREIYPMVCHKSTAEQFIVHVISQNIVDKLVGVYFSNQTHARQEKSIGC